MDRDDAEVAGDIALLAWLSQEGYQELRVLDDGTIVGLSDLLYTRAIYVGLNRGGWEKRFCFEDRELATAQYLALQTGDDEPVGYIARRGKGAPCEGW